MWKAPAGFRDAISRSEHEMGDDHVLAFSKPILPRNLLFIRSACSWFVKQETDSENTNSRVFCELFWGMGMTIFGSGTNGEAMQPTKSLQSQSLVKLPNRLFIFVTRAKLMPKQFSDLIEKGITRSQVGQSLPSLLRVVFAYQVNIISQTNYDTSG